MDPAELFHESAALIERITTVVCRRAHLAPADAEDFAGNVRLALIENDYAVLRKYAGRASLASFLSVVIQRLLLDERTHNLGRWHASAEAERIGPVGVLLERLISRDHRSLDEARALVLAAHPDADVDAILARLPLRMSRPRAVPLDDAPVDTFIAYDRADARALASDTRALADRTSRVVRRTLDALSVEDRMIIRFHFGSGMSIADVSRMMRLPQRPLYRRVEIILGRLRHALTDAGLDAASAGELIGSTLTDEMDFGLSRQSLQDGTL